MNTLDQKFVDNQILPADQLNSIVSKLNEVIRAYNSLDPGVSSEAFASAISNLTQRINNLSQSSATKQELQSAITGATQEFERQLQSLSGQV